MANFRLQADLDRLQAALDRAAALARDASGSGTYDSLCCGTLNGWSVGIKCETDSDKPEAVFLLEGKRSVVRMDIDFLTVLTEFEPTGAIGEKILLLRAKSL